MSEDNLFWFLLRQLQVMNTVVKHQSLPKYR